MQEKLDLEKQQAKFAQLINFSLEPEIKDLNRRVEYLNDRTTRDLNAIRTMTGGNLILNDSRRQSIKRNAGVSKTVKFVEDL